MAFLIHLVIKVETVARNKLHVLQYYTQNGFIWCFLWWKTNKCEKNIIQAKASSEAKHAVLGEFLYLLFRPVGCDHCISTVQCQQQ